MQVKRLIELLSKHDPRAYVLIGDYGTWNAMVDDIALDIGPNEIDGGAVIVMASGAPEGE